jgi:2-keto-4-pentenoate hydratase
VIVDRERYAAGMEVQLARFHEALARGMPRRGWKVGINVPEMLERLGLDHSGVAWLDGWRLVRSGESFDAASGSRLHVEPELCLLIASAPRAGARPDAALRCVGSVAPALEIVNYAKPGSGFDDVVAHGMFHEGCVVGAWGELAQARDLGRRWPVLEVAAGPSPRPRADLVPEHLGELVGFVASFLEAFGERLEEGDLILSGSYTERAVPVTAGDAVRADFGLLGHVEVAIASEAP